MGRISASASALGLILLICFGQPAPAQDGSSARLDKVLEEADRLLEGAKKQYEGGVSARSRKDLVESGFQAEQARLKYQAVLEVTEDEAKRRHASAQIAIVAQLVKLIRDARRELDEPVPSVPVAGDPGKPPPPEAPAPAPAPGTPATPAKALIPDPSKTAEAEKTIREIYKSEYAQKRPAERAALARKLLDQVGPSASDSATAWVLLREALDLAAQAGEAELAAETVQQTSRLFQVDPRTLMTAALAGVAKAAKLPKQFGALAQQYFGLSEAAVEMDDFEAAEKAASAAVQAARKAGDVPLSVKVGAQAKTVSALKTKFEAVRKHDNTLLTHPADPAANLELGVYYCVVRENWPQGLPHLAKGSDAALKAAAERDLVNPQDAAEQAGLGDAWWDCGDKGKSEWKASLQKRAAHWYLKAQPQLSGLNRIRVDKRLGGLAPRAASPSPSTGLDLLAGLDPALDTVSGAWQYDGKTLTSPMDAHARFELPYVPPAEYDLILEVEKLEGNLTFAVGLVCGGSQFTVNLDGYEGDISGITLIDMQRADSNPTAYRGKVFPTSKPVTLVCSVRKNGVTVTADSKKIIEWKGDPKRLSQAAWWKVRRSDVLYVGSFNARFLIRKLSVVELSGKGKRTR